MSKQQQNWQSMVKLINSYESASTEVEKLKIDLNSLLPFFNELNMPNTSLDLKIGTITQLTFKLSDIRKDIIKKG